MKSTNPYLNNLDRLIKDIALNPLRLKTLKCIRCKEETVVYWDYNSVFCEDCIKIVDFAGIPGGNKSHRDFR